MRALLAVSVLAISSVAFNCAAADTGYVEPNITHPQFGEVKIVVPLTSDDPKIWQLKLRNIGNALDAAAKWGGHANIKIVLYSRGVRLLSDPPADVAQALDDLRARGAVFLVCNNTLREAKIDFHTLYHVTDADVVPSGFLEVAWLANQGYAVDAAN